MRDGSAQRSGAETLGKFGGGFQLFSAQASAQHRCANITQSRLALRMNAGVVAEDIVGDLLGRSGKQFEVKARVKLSKETFGGPAFLEEEILHAGFVAVFAQMLLVAKDLCCSARHADSLIGKNKCIEANGQMRFLGESSADTQRVANLAIVLSGRESDVVDLRV